MVGFSRRRFKPARATRAKKRLQVLTSLVKAANGFSWIAGHRLPSLSLRAKALCAFAVLAVYGALLGTFVYWERAKLLDQFTELESAYRHEEALIGVNVAVSHAIVDVNTASQGIDGKRALRSIILDLEAIQAGLDGLSEQFPVAQSLAGISKELFDLRIDPGRTNLAELRRTLHNLVLDLDGLTRQVRQRSSAISENYRMAYHSVTLASTVLSLLGMVLFGTVITLFFTRLASDIKKLERRSVEILQGSGGAPLEVTRHDELGGLMKAVNRMAAELEDREKQLAISRQQYYHQEKMAAIGSLAAGIAHEIGNPLAAISGVAQSICEARSSRECAGTGLACQPELILQQTERVAAITREISEFSTPHPPEPQLLDLNALVRSTCHFVRFDRRFRDIDLQLHLDTQLPAVNAVHDQLIQVIMNLLINAADALDGIGDRRRAVTVTTSQRDDRVELRVTDNGCGMAPETLGHAFETFFTTKAPGKGSGLGLPLCRSILDNVDGTIELNSTPDVGTTVTVRLPLPRINRAA